MDAKIVCLNPTPKLIYPRSNGFDIEMKIYDITTLSGNICRLTSINEPKDVLKKIDKASLENVKVALYYFIFDNGEKSEIAKLLKSYYQKRDIPFFCCNADSIYYSSLLLAYVKEYGENVIEDSQTLLIIYDDRPRRKISARSMEIKKTNDYFYFDDIELITDYTLEYSDEEFKKKFIKTSTVFVYFEGYISGQPNAHEKHTLDLIAAKIKDKTIRIINEERMCFVRNAITSKALKYIGKKPFKYDFASIAYYEFILGAFEPWMKTSQNQSFYHKCLISVNQFEIIPLKKTIVFYETFEKIVCADGGNGNEYEKIEQPAVTEIGLAATFIIDSLHSPSVTVHQPAKDVDNAVIIKLDILEFSVEIIQNGKLQSIDLDKVPLMISFADGKVQVGEEAAKIKKTKNSFVVTNLWIIASGLEYDGKPDWGFTIKRDAKHQKYIFFDTFRGKRKATVSFLIAIIIKWAVAKAEISLGRMPETVVIVTHRLRHYLRYELEKACKQTKLENVDMQVHQYKIVQVKEK